MRPAWFPDWSSQVCAVIGAGQSATQEAADLLRGRCRVLVVNNGYQLAPWADVLYACDGRWWGWHNGAPGFVGLKVTQDRDSALHFRAAKVDLLPDDHPERNTFVVDRPGVLGRGDNGGFQATNLALQFGARVVLLLGLDFCGERWHGAHPLGRPQQHQTTLDGWRQIFDAQAPRLARLGVTVVNLSPVSTLTAFPKMSVHDALGRFCKGDRAAAADVARQGDCELLG